jgi:hydrogenase maturation protease
MMEDYDATILIDASPRGEKAGTLYLIEPQIKKLDESADEVVNAHSMNPVRVLQLVHSLGGQPRNLFVVGCEPEVLESADGRIGLSTRMQAAIAPAVDMIDQLVTDLIEGRSPAISEMQNNYNQTLQSGEVR